METHSGAGWFALITGVVVLFSAIIQIRAGEMTRVEARGQLIFAAGMLIAGIGLAFVAPPNGTRVALVGIAGLAAGLLIAERHHEPR
jgi:phosphatidylglycerophosphate synthase